MISHVDWSKISICGVFITYGADIDGSQRVGPANCSNSPDISLVPFHILALSEM